MSTPCSQSLRPNRLVVSEYEVPKVLVSQKWGVYSETPGTNKLYFDLNAFISGCRMLKKSRYVTLHLLNKTNTDYIQLPDNLPNLSVIEPVLSNPVVKCAYYCGIISNLLALSPLYD